MSLLANFFRQNQILIFLPIKLRQRPVIVTGNHDSLPGGCTPSWWWGKLGSSVWSKQSINRPLWLASNCKNEEVFLYRHPFCKNINCFGLTQPINCILWFNTSYEFLGAGKLPTLIRLLIPYTKPLAFVFCAGTFKFRPKPLHGGPELNLGQHFFIFGFTDPSAIIFTVF